MNTSTGRAAPLVLMASAGAQTLSARQSSSTSLRNMYSSVQGRYERRNACIQLFWNTAPLRTPCQGNGGSGGNQRRAPVGGAAKGMPLNTNTPGSLPATPETCPDSTRILGGDVPGAVPEEEQD